ncbi:FtsX-like permease family protein [Actinoplanes sp. NPDC051470]|uniref:ABC transporter permease n=1 Tax=Actinoplanes sp. NPDC051470 TaxID=3157224 RepID=UPI00342B73E3
MSGVLRTQLGESARRPSRLLLTGMAVLVASFVVYATVLAQQITRASILDGLSQTPEAAALVVTGKDNGVPTEQLARLARVPGVTAAVGRVDAGGEVNGRGLSLSSDPGSGPLSTVKVTEGHYPARTGELAVTPRTADRMGLRVGTTFQMATTYDEDGRPGKPRSLTVVGVVSVPDDYGQQAYAPQPQISALTGADRVSVVELAVAPGQEAPVRSAAEAIAGAGAGVRSGADVRLDEARAVADDVDDVFSVVAMFVAITLVAAGLVAASTFRIIFAQRTKQLALLRAVGAGRGALVRALIAEGAMTGLATGVVGVLAALGLGHLVPVIAGAFGTDLASPGVPVLPALGVIALAVVGTVLAVLTPAVSASKVSPLEALRTASTSPARKGIGWPRAVIGVLLAGGAGLVAAYVIMNLPTPDQKNYDPQSMLMLVVASGGLAFLALIALGPVLVRPLLAAAGWPLRRLGPLGRLAVGGVGGAPRRAAAVSVVVALGVTLIAGSLVGASSVQALLERETASSAPADFEVTAADTPLDPKLADQVRARRELTHVVPYRKIAAVTVTGSETKLEANDLAMDAVPGIAKLDVKKGTWHGLRPGQVIISGFAGDVSDLKVGDRTTITAGRRSVPVTVAATLPDSAPLGSGLVLTPQDLTTLGAPAGYSGLLADAVRSGDVARNAADAALRQTVTGPGVGVTVLADQRDEIESALSTLLLIAIGLIGLTVLIAVVGVGTTTALSVVERVRESGLLRALGLSRGGLRAMLTAESGLYGVLGALLGLLLGVPYAWLAVSALGQNAPLTLPGFRLVAVFVVLVILTALAGVLPARRAARVSPVVALATE